MKFIELHYKTDTYWVNTNAIEMIKEETSKLEPEISGRITLSHRGIGYCCNETPEEILQKIAEAEQCEQSFMDDWKNEVNDQLGRLSRLKAKKDGATDATGRC